MEFVPRQFAGRFNYFNFRIFTQYNNFQACKGTDRNFLPSLESYLENPKERTDPSFEWRALRLLARQSPHFFTLFNTPSCKITDYLECVHKKIQKDKLETKVELEEVVADPLDNEVFEDTLDDTEQLTPEEKHSHKPATASTEQIADISKAIGTDWKKLGTKLGEFLKVRKLYFFYIIYRT